MCQAILVYFLFSFFLSFFVSACDLCVTKRAMFCHVCYRCHHGWKGTHCNECLRYPGCLHGTCQKPWECACVEGWGGLFCNQDLNYCTNHKPCLNGGTCFNTGQGSYTCACPSGYAGERCETLLVDCHSKPCQNGGTCTNVSTSYVNSTELSSHRQQQHHRVASYRCTCPPGWRGRHCEITTKSCRDSPCKHGATCEDDSGQGYICRCPAGYTGTDCDTQVDDCAPNPCMNNGTCTDIINGYRCTCPVGFTGERCEINVDDCEGDPCLNGGTCLDQVNSFRCQCVPGYVGRLCQDKVNYCMTKPCANGGRCITMTNDYYCVCKPGFTGKDCSVDVDECRSAPCFNGGTCKNRVDGFQCECPKGWHGPTCSEEPEAMPTPLPSAPTTSTNTGAVPPSGTGYWTGNLSKHVASRDAGLTPEHLVMIATLSTAVPAFVLFAVVAVMCMKRRQKREQARADEEARLQNERNAVHSSMSKRSASTIGVGTAGGGLGMSNGGGSGSIGGLLSSSGSGLIGAGGGSVCALGAGDAHMIKNTWTASKSVNNVASVARQDDLDTSFQTDVTLDSSCSGYKPEPVLQDGRTTRTTKQLNTEAAAHRASAHLYQKEKDCLGLGLGIGVLESAKRSSVFVGNADSCCATEAALIKRPTTISEASGAGSGGIISSSASSGPPGSGGGGATDNSSCGVYVIDDHYRHDTATLAETLATEV